jgi:hypothetical protein
MKRIVYRLSAAVGPVDQSRVRLWLALLALILLVLGGGAPGVPGGSDGGG